MPSISAHKLGGGGEGSHLPPNRRVSRRPISYGHAPVKLPDGIGIVQPLALAIAAGGGGNQATYTRQLGTYQGGGGGDYGITQGGKVSVRL